MQNLIENLKEYLDPVNDGQLRSVLDELSAAEIAEIWDNFSNEESLRIFALIQQDKRSDLISELHIYEQEHLIRELSEGITKTLLNGMEPDNLVDLIQSVSPELRSAVWEQLSEETRRETTFLLRFDEDDAAGIMTPRYAAILGGITVAQALKFIRKTMDEMETIYYLYVVDKLKRLNGVVSLKDILRANDSDRIEDIMIRKVIYVHDDTDQEESARVLENHGLLALPVVDRFNRLLGIITFDDVIDVIREEQTEDIYKMGAMGGNTNSYLETSSWGLVKKRIPWLIILLVAGTITTNVLHLYQDLLLAAAFLTLFIPVITQTGGNSGTQSSTLMIRGLATGELHFRDIGKVMLKEIIVGLFLGITTGVVILTRAYFTPPGIEFLPAIAIAISLCSVVIFATVLGAFVPMLIHKIGFDPTVAAGPLMSTVIDVCGLTIFFEVSKRILTL
ncbi:magnesium transporter [Oceanispirochaeta crateris]|uniref:Magnesium transporter MgtE n=1 Tax=Oceanispirochaeta crateris TaxID=2518645 RepID=A0A5C1QN85_9SPIO|nr:magnesium transporter [Oceanispirochaeta crateris]QEN08024.1 magnesium transporter [Oceanispirochaeta crateris]